MKKSIKRQVSIVMPCLNEEKTLGICIEKALKYMDENDVKGEVIIADNGSTDNSIKIAKKLGARVVNVKEKGYGSALRGGIEAAKYNYIVMGDADDSYDFYHLNEFIDKLDEGYELVMGNRFKGGIEKGAMSFSHQYIGNPVLSGIGRLFFRTSIKDFHCGLRAFRKDAIERLNLCTTGMEFASEMVVKSVLFDLKMTEVPCKLHPDGRDRPPHLRSIPDGLRHLEFLFLYSPKWLFAYPGLILFFVGLIFSGSIYFRPMPIGRIQFDVTSMLYGALAMIIGLQLLQFACFSTIFSERIGQKPKTSKLTHSICNLLNKCGYAVAAIISIIGIVGVIYTFVEWKNVGFGAINTTDVCKTAVFFGSLLAIGIETLIFTLFTRILQIKGKE